MAPNLMASLHTRPLVSRQPFKICLVELQSDYVALRTRLINIFVGDDDDPTEQSAGADYEISNFVCARIDDRFVQPARWLTVAGQ